MVRSIGFNQKGFLPKSSVAKLLTARCQDSSSLLSSVQDKANPDLSNGEYCRYPLFSRRDDIGSHQIATRKWGLGEKSMWDSGAKFLCRSSEATTVAPCTTTTAFGALRARRSNGSEPAA